jgi:hypothetical protein
MNTPTLNPCEECKGTGETIIEKHNCDCPDCLGTGLEQPQKRIMQLERQLAEARETWRMSSVCRELRQQCDTLAEALSMYGLPYSHDDLEHMAQNPSLRTEIGTHEAKRELIRRKALATVKGELK